MIHSDSDSDLHSRGGINVDHLRLLGEAAIDIERKRLINSKIIISQNNGGKTKKIGNLCCRGGDGVRAPVNVIGFAFGWGTEKFREIFFVQEKSANFFP